jgi:hypothetical protein
LRAAVALPLIAAAVTASLAVAGVAHAAVRGSGAIKPARGTNCMDLAGQFALAGVPAALNTCLPAGPGVNQVWDFNGDGTVQDHGLNLCLDLFGGATAPGTRVIIQACDATKATQRWTVQLGGFLLNQAAGSCLDTVGGSLISGTRIQISACVGAAPWFLPAGPIPPPPPPIQAPTLSSVQSTGTTVTVTWTDGSTNENAFSVNRGQQGVNPLPVGQVASTTTAGTGTAYTFTDTIPPGTRQCYQVTSSDPAGDVSLESNQICTPPPSPLPACDGIACTGTTSLVDTLPAGTSGGFHEVSNAIGSDGLGISSYYAEPAGHLRVAHCADVGCTSATTHDVDTTGVTGRYSSIAIGSDGLPLISYVAQVTSGSTVSTNLKVAHCADVACSSATITTLDSPNVDNFTSLAIGPDGLGTIAYQNNAPSTAVDVAHCLNPACTASTRTTVDAVTHNNGGQSGSATEALAVSPNGTTYIAYTDASLTTGGLKVAACADPACGTVTARTTIDPAAAGVDPGWAPSMTIGDDGLPLIGYQRLLYTTGAGGVITLAGADLMVAHCSNAACTAATTARGDTGGRQGGFTSIAVGTDGFGVVSYQDQTNQDLKVAHCTNAACSAMTQVAVVDQFGNLASEATSISIGADGLPLISYTDLTTPALKVAHCGDVACSRPLGTPFITRNK